MYGHDLRASLFKALGRGPAKRMGPQRNPGERGHAYTPLRGDFTVAPVPLRMEKRTTGPGGGDEDVVITRWTAAEGMVVGVGGARKAAAAAHCH